MLRTELIRPLHELLARHGELRGSQPSFSDDRRTLTWIELKERTGRLAAHVRRRVGGGKAVAICMANRVEAVESYIAVPRAGNVAAFLNPGASVSELAYMLEDSGAEVLITDAPQREGIRHAIDRVPALREVIVVDGAAESAREISYEA